MVQYLKGALLVHSINGINAVIWITLTERGDTACNVGDAHSSCKILKVIEHFELVIVSVSKELACYSRLISIDNCIIVSAPSFEATHWIHMPNNVNFFTNILTCLQGVN